MSNDTNTGNHNSGYYNSGNYNSGKYNSGYCNYGYYNSGDCNSGYYNSGNYNSGNYNSGYRNSGNYNSGDCNTNNPTVRIFNHDSGWVYFDDNHSRFRAILNRYQRALCEWVSTANMTDQEKKDNASHETTGGYLKVNESTFNGNDINPEHEEFLRSVPNFDAKILLECTGIDITNAKKKIVMDGKEILISRESFDEIKKQFIGE